MARKPCVVPGCEETKRPGHPRWCTLGSMPRGYPLVGVVTVTREPLEQRLWAKVDMRGSDECWPWTASVMRSGRGKISVDGRLHPAPRVVVALRDGLDLADRWVARHSCANPPCCNPAHLSSGSSRDNAADMVRHGHSTAGARHPMAKLNAVDVLDIRTRRAAGTPRRILAKEYSVHVEHVTRITSGRSW